MNVTYAGVDCVCRNEAIAAHLEAFCDPNEILQFETIASHNLWHLPIPPAFQPPPVRINTLNWPSDASRFSTCWLIVDDEDLATLRPMCFTNSGPVGRALAIVPESDDQIQIEPISVTMVALPPRPLTQFGVNEPGMWLLPLVDQRYFWWMRSANFASFSSWSDLVSQVYTAVGATGSASTLPAAYGIPSERFVAYQQPIPIYLDAVAKTIGMRVVAKLDGTIQLENYADSVSIQGDQLALDSGRDPRSGGLFLDADVNKNIPSEVVVVFPKTIGGVRSNVPYTTSVSLTGLSLSEYSGVTGYSGSKVIYGNLIAAVTSGPDPDNLGDLDTYAAQAATDWYLWQLTNVDLQYDGIINWTPNGQQDAIDWKFFAEMCSTRICRDPYNEWSWGTLHATDFLDQSTVIASGSAVTFKDDKGNSVTSTIERLMNSTVTNDAGEAKQTIDDASPTASGLVNTSAQKYEGVKSFQKSVNVNIDASDAESLAAINDQTLCFISGDSYFEISRNTSFVAPASPVENNMRGSIALVKAYYPTPANEHDMQFFIKGNCKVWVGSVSDDPWYLASGVDADAFKSHGEGYGDDAAMFHRGAGNFTNTHSRTAIIQFLDNGVINNNAGLAYQQFHDDGHNPSLQLVSGYASGTQSGSAIEMLLWSGASAANEVAAHHVLYVDQGGKQVWGGYAIGNYAFVLNNASFGWAPLSTGTSDKPVYGVVVTGTGAGEYFGAYGTDSAGNVFKGGIVTTISTTVPYAASNPTEWLAGPPGPTTMRSAIDRLASAVFGLLGSPIP